MEYRYSQFENERIFSDAGLTRVDLDPTMHTVRTTITYKFGSNSWGAKRGRLERKQLGLGQVEKKVSDPLSLTL
jgi:hypothetical protein